MSLLLNRLWIVFGGLWMAIAWVIAAVIMAITIIGLPWTGAALNMRLNADAFGKSRIARRLSRP